MRKKQQMILNIVKIMLLCITAFLFSICWHLYYGRIFYELFYQRADCFVIALFFLLYMGCSKLYGGFNLTTSRITEIIYSQCIAIVVTHFLMYFLVCLIMQRLPNIIPILGNMSVCMILAAGWAKLANRITNKLVPPKKTILIYDNEEAYKNGLYIIKHISWRFSLMNQFNINIGTIPILKLLQEQRPEAVMLCGLHSSQRNTILKYCIEQNILVYLRPNIGDYIVNSAKNIQVANLPVMLCYRAEPTIFYAVAKRAVDIILGCIGLIITSPIMLVTAVAIYCYDRGPIFYKQLRLTKDRKCFYIYKFRSMKVDAEKDGVAKLACQNDGRITPVGRVIRSCRVDELPQIICILKGDMSIVGPRPERPEIAEQYEQEIPEFALRLQVKAGLTGYAQVYGKYNTDPYDKLQMDLMYISQMSLVTDAKIMLATVKVLFMPESTEGVEERQISANKKIEDCTVICENKTLQKTADNFRQERERNAG